MITAISDSSDRPVTVPNPLRSLPKTALDLQRSPNSDRSDSNFLVPAPYVRKALNQRNPSIGHCCHCTKIRTIHADTP